ncbi:hypothetical protein C8J57DRAFT_1249108 [Mycena rebaudengoi]|nr:hypothetical protein C8J57DRAFT_1249108 [Mycena rebaudengoi]
MFGIARYRKRDGAHPLRRTWGGALPCAVAPIAMCDMCPDAGNSGYSLHSHLTARESSHLFYLWSMWGWHGGGLFYSWLLQCTHLLGETSALEGLMMVATWDYSIAAKEEGNWRTLMWESVR